MKKKSLFSIVLFLATSALTGCAGREKSFFVTFKNWNDEVLYHRLVEKGTVISYEGEIPTKDKTADKVFTFSGWDKDTNAPITQNTVFNAVYSSETRKYVVDFLNWNGELLEEQNVDYGSCATYTGETPTKISNDRHVEYFFSHWDKNIKNPIYEDTTFFAEYGQNDYVFATFLTNKDEFITETKCRAGGKVTPPYTTKNPIVNMDERKALCFVGWDKSLNSIKEDTTFKEVWEEKNVYTVTFVNYDGSKLYETYAIEGEGAQYGGSTPTRPDSTSGDYIYSYTFSGWNKSISNIYSDTIVTAQFTSTSENYKYPLLIDEMINYVRDKGGYSSGSFGFVFSIFSSGGYIYTGTLEYGSELSILMAMTNGSNLTAVRISLPPYWNNGYFPFRFQMTNSGKDNIGTGRFYGPSFTSSTTLTFGSYYGDLAETVAAYQAALMISIALDEFAKASTWSMRTLGFNNYNY